jgi:hypothetical protein
LGGIRAGALVTLVDRVSTVVMRREPFTAKIEPSTRAVISYVARVRGWTLSKTADDFLTRFVRQEYADLVGVDSAGRDLDGAHL